MIQIPYSELTAVERSEVEEFGASVKLYTIKQVAAILGVSTRTVNNYVKDRRLVGVKIGGRWKFSEQEIRRFMGGEAKI